MSEADEAAVMATEDALTVRRPVLWLPKEMVGPMALAALDPVESVLDIGCGIRPSLDVRTKVHICVEPCEQYIAPLQAVAKQNTDRVWVILRATWGEAVKLFAEQSVDTVVLIDVIEHLPKAEAAELLRATERIARRQVVIFTPLGFMPQHHPDGKDAWGYDGGAWQEHKSGWLPDEFDDCWDILASREYHTTGNMGNALEHSYGAFWAVRTSNNENMVEGPGSPALARQLLEIGETVLMDRGPLEVANRCFLKALSLDQEYADAYCDLGTAYWQGGKSDLAMYCFRKAMELQPGADISKENYLSVLKSSTSMAWQQAYETGYTSTMGDHRRYRYNRFLLESGYYQDVAGADIVVEFGPGNGDFMKALADAYPHKQFFLIDVAEPNARALRQRFANQPAVHVVLDSGEPLHIPPAGSVFSFLVCQSMPATLWKEHLREVYRMMKAGGAYVFQFAFHPSGEANDQPAVAIAGSNTYAPETMTSLLKETGFRNIYMTGRITLEEFKSDILWYICRAVK